MTIYKRVKYLVHEKKVNPLTPIQKQEVGKLVADYFFQHFIVSIDAKVPYCKAKFMDDGVQVTVMSYPKIFTTEMDRIIIEYYESIKPRVRKRLKRKELVYSHQN